MLDWNKLCEHVARFASTHAGKRACRALVVPEEPAETLRLIEQTRAITLMEFEWSTSLDYGGIQTSEAEQGLSRAAKGGMLSAQQLRGIVTLVNGSERLRKQVVTAARDNDALHPTGPARTLLAAVGRVKAQPHIVRSVAMAIDEDNNIQDSASEQLRGLRARVKAIVARLASMLKGYGGEVSDKGGRVCVAVPSGTKIPNGVLLGMAPGGSLLYIEPPAAVGLNNELGAARAEAEAAEEGVLWNLTGLVMGSLEELQDAYRTVAYLDVLSARARYGIWIEGTLPDIVPWDKVFHARGAAAVRRRALAAAEGGDEAAPSASFSDPDERYAVRLRGLRHPLLYGEYLLAKEALERECRMSPAGASWAGSSGATVSSGGGGGRRRMLSTRKEVMLRPGGLSGGGGSGASSGADDSGSEETYTPQSALAALRPPRPVDWIVRPDTSVVVITGPNTGGKTAGMKALGLAACMAKAGLALPAEAPARLPAFSAVLADIGDEQSLTANLSTFSGHLRRIQGLRAEADGKALLLLDELGTGTDPLEGAALGVALLKRLVNGGIGSGALTVATTHHSVMTGLKFDDGRFENASVEFDEAAMAPTYKLLWGIPGRSNALNIALRLGLDEDVVAAARERMDSGVADVNSAIEQLETLRGALEAEERAGWLADKEVRTLQRRLQVMGERIEQLRDTMSKARAEALLQVYALARDRIRAIKDNRKRLGKAAPAPKSILAPTPAPAPAAPPPPAREPTVEWPSEDDIWDAWESANKVAEQQPKPAASASALGGPAPSGPSRPAASTPTSAASTSRATTAPATQPPAAPAPSSSFPLSYTTSSAPSPASSPVVLPGADAASDLALPLLPLPEDDPLRPLLELSGDADGGGLGLEAMVDSLAAAGEAAASSNARRHQEEADMYDAAVLAVEDILVAASARRAVQAAASGAGASDSDGDDGVYDAGQRGRQQRETQGQQGRQQRQRQQQEDEDEDGDDPDLAALMSILEEGEAALNARVSQLNGGSSSSSSSSDSGSSNNGGSSSSSNSGNSGNAGSKGAVSSGAGNGAGRVVAPKEVEVVEEDDDDDDVGMELDALMESLSWERASQGQLGQQQHQVVTGVTAAGGGGGSGGDDDEDGYDLDDAELAEAEWRASLLAAAEVERREQAGPTSRAVTAAAVAAGRNGGGSSSSSTGRGSSAGSSGGGGGGDGSGSSNNSGKAGGGASQQRQQGLQGQRQQAGGGVKQGPAAGSVGVAASAGGPGQVAGGRGAAVGTGPAAAGPGAGKKAGRGKRNW